MKTIFAVAMVAVLTLPAAAGPKLPLSVPDDAPVAVCAHYFKECFEGKISFVDRNDGKGAFLVTWPAGLPFPNAQQRAAFIEARDADLAEKEMRKPENVLAEFEALKARIEALENAVSP